MIYLDGARLKRLRLERRMNQRKLAEKARMSQSTIELLDGAYSE